MSLMTRTLRDRGNLHPYSRALRPRPYQLGLAAASTGRFGDCAWKILEAPVVARLSQSVVSIASFIGDTKLLERTGTCIQTSCPNATSFLTSARLGPRTAEGKISDTVTIKVCLPDGQIVEGKIEHESVFLDYAVVNTKHVPGLHATNLDHDIQFRPYRRVAAVWRRFSSGLLMATSGVELGSPAVKTFEIMLSTCQVNGAGIGSPLVDFDGNFVGMNSYYSERKMTPFLQRVLILESLGHRGIVSMGMKQRMDVTREGITSEIQKSSTPGNSSSRAVLPLVINSFEDVFDDDIWGVLPKRVASRISRSVVSLASFDEDATFFACTGFVAFSDAFSTLIMTSASLVRVSGDVQMIKTNLRIEVCLRNRFRVIGMLRSYDLTFNVACIEIMGNWNLLAVRTNQDMWSNQPRYVVKPDALNCPDVDVIALGCLFDGFKIMATSGKLLTRKSKLDCPELRVSTCKITKAGVGGPLMDTSGNLLGINFYHHEETPFIPLCDKCFRVCFFAGEILGIEKYRWPVPKPCPYRQWPPMELKPKDVELADLGSLKLAMKPVESECGVIFPTPRTITKVSTT